MGMGCTPSGDNFDVSFIPSFHLSPLWTDAIAMWSVRSSGNKFKNK